MNVTLRLRLALLATIVVSGSLLAGCREDDPSAPPPQGPQSSCIDEDGDGFGPGCAAGLDCDDTNPLIFDECPGPDDPPPGECADGTTKDCKVTLPEHNGVKSCFEGVQTCEDGAWGECSKKQHDKH